MSVTPLVLATDLDGTLAAGTKTDTCELIAELAAHPAPRLVYVTGRSEASARALIEREALPIPAVLIADVGTSVLRGVGPARLQAVEEAIAARWPGSDEVQAALAGVAGLEPQDVRASRRVSYWIADNLSLRGGARARDDFEARAPSDVSFSESAERVARSVAARAAAALHKLDVDVLLSGNVFLDVLPGGVNKGWTLRRVLEALNVDTDECVVAGDSLNDRALFDIGADGILVSNCEPALRDALAGQPRIYRAAAAGAGGILEGLRFLRRLPAHAVYEGSDYGQ